MDKPPKQTGTQTTSMQGTLPDWLDSRYQSAAGGADALYNSGGNPAVAQAQQALNSAQNSYNSQSSNTPDGWRFDPSGSGATVNGQSGGYRRMEEGTTAWMDPHLAERYGGGMGGGSSMDSSEVDAARAALAQAQAQPWDESQDPLYRDKVGFSDQTQMGMNSMMDQANSGSMDNAFDQWNNTLTGDYLYGGDAFSAAQDAASRRIIPQVTSAFNQSGRMGGIAGQSELTGRLGDSFAGLYNNERGRQMSALGMSPAMSQLGYEPARRQLQVGMIQDAKNMENNEIDFSNKNMEGQRLDQYLQRLGGIAPNFRGQDSTKPVYSQGGGIGSLLGAGLSVAGMATGNPFLGMAGGGFGGFGSGLNLGAGSGSGAINGLLGMG
jgi:hypothetical protein